MIAVAAFVVLDPADEVDPQSAFTAAADPQCVAAKREIIRVQSTGAGGAALGPRAVVAMIGAAVGRWRRDLRGLRAPPEATAARAGLDAALGRLSGTLGPLRRAIRDGDDSKVAAGAQAVNQAAAEVDAATAALGLERCAAIALTGSAP